MSITFEEVTAITQEPIVIFGIVLVYLIPIIAYIIAGVTVKARSPSGTVLSSPMITNPNYYIALIIWGLLGLIFYIIFIIFPVHILILEKIL